MGYFSICYRKGVNITWYKKTPSSLFTITWYKSLIKILSVPRAVLIEVIATACIVRACNDVFNYDR